MPKVVYSKSKGLRQSAGEGFEVSEVAIRPSYESKVRQLVTGADIDKTGAEINGKYFVYYNRTQKVVVWFQAVTDAASQPSVPSADKFIKVAVADADAKADVVGKAKTAVDGADSAVTLIDGADGTFKIEGNLPYAAAGTAHAGTLGTAVAQTAAGSGLNTLAMETHGISVIDENVSAYSAAQVYTLGSGAHIGAMKTIIRTTDDNTDVTVSVAAGYIANDTGAAARVFTFGEDTDTTARTLILNWDGSAWVIVKMSAGISITT